MTVASPAADAGAGTSRGGLSRLVLDPWRYRELLRGVVRRNLKVKYQRSLLGLVWALLNPLLTVLVLIAVFGYVVRIPLENYWAFVLSGYFVWNAVFQTLNAGTFVFVEHARLVRSVAFPSSILVVGAVISRFAEFAVALVLALVALIVFHHGALPASVALLPLLLVIQVCLLVGLTLPVTMLSAFYHDVQHALPLALTTLFYASPVFYPVSLVPEAIRPLYMLNPVAALLTLYQQVLYEGVLPDARLLLGAAAGSFAVLIVGYALYSRYAAVYAEIV